MTPNLPKPAPKLPPKLPPKSAPGAMPAPLAKPVAASPAAAPPAAARGAAPGLPGVARPAPTPPGKGAPTVAARPATRPVAGGLPESVAQIVEALTLFDGILIEENTLLRQQRAREAVALQERKLAAGRLYQERMRVLLQTGLPASGISQAQRDQILALARGMEGRATENAILLKATIHSIDRLFEAISTTAKRKTNKEVTYSKKAVIRGSLTPATSSIAFNRTV